MVLLSEILIEEYALMSFTDLEVAVKKRAAGGERFLEFDIKPQFADTPADWESVLESIFTARI
ncbi:MAG: hypothetical protein V3R25_06335 [Nitrosomonadaceae bacterium]